MGFLRTIENWRWKIFLFVGLPIIGVAALVIGGMNVGPAFEAANGGGTPGTYVALSEKCRKRSCTFEGTWTAADGSSTRTGVELLSEPDGMALGTKVPAVDTGADAGVFGPDSKMHLWYAAVIAIGLAALAGWVWVIVRAVRKRRPEAAPALNEDVFRS